MLAFLAGVSGWNLFRTGTVAVADDQFDRLHSAWAWSFGGYSVLTAMVLGLWWLQPPMETQEREA